MKTNRFSALAIGISISVMTGLGPARAQVAALAKSDAMKIVLVGDSTVSVLSGWGGQFCSSHVTTNVACVDLARQGRSTASFRSEGHWARALGELSVGDYRQAYVLIQFGHNDQPGKPGHSTDLATEFPNNLRRYVQEARAVGATPVLVTPLTRRQFVDGRLQNTLVPWADAIRQVAKETATPLVDLNAQSAAEVQAMGPAAAARFAQVPPAEAEQGTAVSGDASRKTTPPSTNLQTYAAIMDPGAADDPRNQVKRVFDQAHLGGEGAGFFSSMVAKLLAQAVPALRSSLLP
jgi:lysophospholipase L1-like esterase